MQLRLKLVLVGLILATPLVILNNLGVFDNFVSEKPAPEVKQEQEEALTPVKEVQMKYGLPVDSFELIDNVIAADSPEKIDGLLTKLEKKIDSMPADAKFLGSHLLLMKPFRGIVYRMIPLAGK